MLSKLLLFGLIVPAALRAQTMPDEERAVRRAEAKLASAAAEVGTDNADILNELVADDFLGVETSGREFDKRQWVASYQEIVFDSARREGWIAALREYTTQEMRVRIYGGSAVVTGLRKRGSSGHRFVHVWKWQQERWQLAVSQSTILFPYPKTLTRGNPDTVQS